MKPFAQEHLDELREAHADFTQAVAPAETDRCTAFWTFVESYEDPDDIDWVDPRILALWDRYNAKTAAARKTYSTRVAASETKYRENRVAVMGR